MAPFQDGFESGTFNKWSLVRNIGLQQQDVYSGAWAARALSTSNLTSYARATLSAPTNDLYLRIRFMVVSKGTGTVYILRFRSAADATILGVYISGSGKLGIRNDVSGISTTSGTTVTTGVWHEVQVHGLIAPGGRTDVWLDGSLVTVLSKAQALGSTSAGIIQIGENTNGQMYDIPIDDVAADTSFITGAVPPTATPMPTDTATSIPTPTGTPLPTATATNTSIPAATNTPAPSSTLIPASTSTAVATDTPQAPTSTATATAVADSTPPPASASFGPVADSYTSQPQPTRNFGTAASLWVDQGSGVALQSFVRFSVTGVTQTVSNATLWMYASNGTNVGPTIATAGNGWAETGITWNTMPAPGASQFPSVSPIGAGTWISVNVTAVVTGNGDFSFTLVANSTDAAAFNSRENATNHPRLDLTFSSTPLPTATPTSSPTIGPSATPSPTPSITPTASPTATSIPGSSVVVMAAGDIVCGAHTTSGWCKQSDTANVILNANPAAVLALGDVQYECAEMSDFLTYFNPTWGQFKGKIYPTTGNHEYKTGSPCVTATGDGRDYFQYFGAVAGDPGKGYYSFNLGSWHIVSLNTNCSKVGGCAAGSAQEVWLRADLAAHPTSCTMAFMHYPRYSTVAPYSSLTDLWQALYDNDAEIVLAAHDHHYERFGPRNATGSADQARGIVEFIVGTGGKQPNQQFGGMDTPLATGTAPGVIKLTLNSSSYDWQFVPTAGYTYNDSGSRACHGPSASGGGGQIVGASGSDSTGGPTSASQPIAAEPETAQRLQHAVAAHVSFLSIATVWALLILVFGRAVLSDPRAILRRVRALDRGDVTPVFERSGG